MHVCEHTFSRASIEQSPLHKIQYFYASVIAKCMDKTRKTEGLEILLVYNPDFKLVYNPDSKLVVAALTSKKAQILYFCDKDPDFVAI